MKKLLGILFTMVLLVSVLTACGKGSKDESSSDAGSGTGEKTSYGKTSCGDKDREVWYY